MARIIKQGLEIFLIEKKSKEELDSKLLPSIYKSFITNYKVGRDATLKPIVYFDSRYNEKLSVARLTYIPNPGEIVFGCFFSIEESEEIMSRVFVDDDKNLLNACRLIGEDGTGHYFIMVGVSEENMDQIFIESTDKSFSGGERLTKVSNDIYSFINDFAFVEMEEGIGYGVEYNQLYKNWGEDFWRVTKEKEST